MLEVLSRRVFAAFHRFEAALTRFTDRVGVYCVFFCTVLLVLGTITFFDVYFAEIFLGPNVSLSTTLAGTLWSVYLVCNIAFHYWSAVTILPGSPSDPPGTVRTRPFLSWKNQRSKAKPHKLSDTESRRRRHQRILDAQRAAISSAPNSSTRSCKRCPLVQDPWSPDTWKQPAKPERAHHCSICATCWLAFDHHCPWINGCVGLYNARYFLLFMVYMALACSSVALLGFKTMLGTLDFRESWPHLTPRPFTLLLWVLSVAMAFALTVMSLWQNETSVEANDNDYYRKLTKRNKRDFLPPYDLGWRENLADFFNVGPDRHPWWTVLLPLRIEPVSDGWVWNKRPGWHLAKIEEAEMLTDEEGG